MPYNPVNEHQDNQLMREVMGKKYNPATYKYEKIIGKRTKTGELKLKRLKPLHRQMLHMHLGCYSNRDIAFHLNVDEITVSRVLRDPLSQEIINTYASGIDAELEALLPLGVDVIRKAVLSDNAKIALQGADKLFRALGKFDSNRNVEKQETAEDVIARALGIVETQANAIEGLVDRGRPKALDIQFEEVSDGSTTNSSDKALKRLP